MKKININTLYSLALAEEEGIGTAYEYFVKLRLLSKFIESKRIKHVLIYGLPEKYGFSIDFVLFGQINNFNITIVDDRKERIKSFEKIINNLIKKGLLLKKPRIIKLKKLNNLKFNKRFGLLVCSEVMQRLSNKEKIDYIKLISKISKYAALFVPNKNNKMHSTLSKIDGLSLDELKEHFNKENILNIGYIDMPLFPPGLKKKKRKEQINSLFSLLFMAWARFEILLPKIIKKKIAHICYIIVKYEKN